MVTCVISFKGQAVPEDEKESFIDDASNFIDTLKTNGAFRYGKEGLDIDFDLMIEISKRNNPVSLYWKQF